MIGLTGMMKNIIKEWDKFWTPYQQIPVNSAYRPDIDGLRAIAVSAVIIFHVFPTHLTGGFVGVDMFFVISGYLISSIIYNELDAGSFTFFRFYGRRVRRIFPSLIVVLLACYLAGQRFLHPIDLKKLGAHIVAASGFLSNFLLSRESGYFDDAADTKPLLHLWSLGIEEQFYIIWPMLLYFSWKAKLNLVTLTIGLTLSSFALNIIRVKTNSVQTFYWPTTRVWELLIGACLAFMTIHMKDYFENIKCRLDRILITLTFSEVSEPNGSTLRNVTSIIGSLLVIMPMCFLTKSSVFPGWWAAAPTIGTALLISVGTTPWINRKILSSHLLVGIGLISYPLYLWHWPLLIFINIMLKNNVSNYVRVGIIFMSIFMSWVTHICVDKPFRLGRFLNIKFAFLCISMIGMGFLGYHTNQYNDFSYGFQKVVGYHTNQSNASSYRSPKVIGNYKNQSNGLFYRDPKVVQDIVNFESRGSAIMQSYRYTICHLDVEQDETKFGNCVDNIEKPTSTAITLWGDSHAAHLYPGIKADKPNVRVTQLTAGACPPITEFSARENRHCRRISNYTLNRILKEKPNTVILAAYWYQYDWSNLTYTIKVLKNAAIKNIYLVGPIPIWQNTLPKTLYNYGLQHILDEVPMRMRFGLIPKIDTLDEKMQAFAFQTKISYISPYKILCNSDGCLTRTGDSVDTLLAWDYGHLSIDASTFVVSHFPKTLLHPTGSI